MKDHLYIKQHFFLKLDVIQAYKSIIKEKEALEASLAALNDTDTQKKSVKEEKTVSDGSGADENSEETSEVNISDV